MSSSFLYAAACLWAASSAVASSSTEFAETPTPTWTTVTTTVSVEGYTGDIQELNKRVTFFTTVFAWPTWMIGHHAGMSFQAFKALPENATAEEIRFQPVLDYDKDSCYNQPAINQGGLINEGLTSYAVQELWGPGCRNDTDLDNQNVYVRSRCNNGWCAYMYEHYWRKDVDEPGMWGPERGGHRHEWENAVIFVKNGEDMPAYVAHQFGGKYKIRHRNKIQWQGSHAKLVYHKCWLRKHTLRFASPRDNHVKNARGVWIRGALIGWDNWPDSSLRDKLIEAFGNVNNEVKPKLSECFFSEWLQRATRNKIKYFEPMSWQCKSQGGANQPYSFWEKLKWLMGYNDPPIP